MLYWENSYIGKYLMQGEGQVKILRGSENSIAINVL